MTTETHPIEIKQLQSEIEALKGCDATIALLSHQMGAVCERVGLGADHALHDYVPLLGNRIDILTREIKQLYLRASELESALRIIALSYKYRIDHHDKEPWEFAQDTLEQLGIDIEKMQEKATQ